MPKIEEHARLSKIRTGKPFLELHEWVNEECKNPNIYPKRHDITKIPRNLKIVKEKFGDDAIEEFLYHIGEDYEKDKAYRMMKLLLTMKRAVFSPFSLLKSKISRKK